MFRTTYWMTYFWFYLVSRIGGLRKAGKMDKTTKEYRDLVNFYVKDWSGRLLRLAGARVKVFGEENLPLENAVFVSNHQGQFDIPLMLHHVGTPRAILAKAEIAKLPLVRDWMMHLDCLFVDRNDPKDALKAVVNAIKYVKAGNSMTIFPEGTRSKGNNIGVFKPGSTKIAIKGGAIIVPITIDGSYKLLEKNKGFKITPADVNITIHKPVDPKTLEKEELDNIDNILRDIIKSAL